MSGHDTEPDETQERPSKSQRKRDMTALQDLGKRLVELPPGRLAALDLPADLAEAVAFARGLKAHGALRRQLQFIGRLMREIDAAPIAAALAGQDRQSRAEAQRFQHLEALRDRLIAEGDSALDDVLAEFPGAERARLRQLARQAAQEQERDQPPRAARSLFRYLRELSEQD